MFDRVLFLSRELISTETFEYGLSRLMKFYLIIRIIIMDQVYSPLSWSIVTTTREK